MARRGGFSGLSRRSPCDNSARLGCNGSPWDRAGWLGGSNRDSTPTDDVLSYSLSCHGTGLYSGTGYCRRICDFLAKGSRWYGTSTTSSGVLRGQRESCSVRF